MAFRFQSGSFFSRSNSTKSRRPQGVSRRQRKRQLGFETLEDRRVMSADSPLANLQDTVADTQFQVQSYSSADEAGQLQILLNELYWQSLINDASQSTASVTNSVPTDPLIENQWHLVNNGLLEVGNPDFQPIFGTPGEDINLGPVWAMGLTGAGVTVAVIDTGTQTSHPDLVDNISSTLQLNAASGVINGNPNSLFVVGDAHGTATAGLIGAVADNGLGGAGVAPGVTLAPINYLGNQTADALVNAFRFAIDEIDITNNSWSRGDPRTIAGPTAAELLAIRDSVIFGRDGLGVIHVFSSGNSAGSGFDPGFQNQGSLDSSTYNGFVSSRYTIGVTGVDHDGFYNNVDGTITSYPETSAGVLIAAPTGSVALALGSDTGVGSGIVTTDFTGDFGFNGSDNTGFPFGDRDFLAETDFTSRFNGTSASAPLVSGVVALMLEANPNLSWRDVQEILVRSARQNAEFDVPTTGNGQGGTFGSTQNTWITNQMPVFHDPDPISVASGLNATLSPTLDPNIGLNHYVPTPMVNTNGAGFTVSQGTGAFDEEIGYAHGVVDAELAVLLSQQWGTKNQSLADELTFTTFPVLGASFFDIPASEVGNDDSGNQLVPGGLGGESGFIDYWNEYFADDPFSGDDPPVNERGVPISFSVPDSAAMSIETVEVKMNITGGTVAALDFLRIILVSPDGTHSELNDFFVEQTADGRFGFLQNETPATKGIIGTAGSQGSGDLVATFTTNRSWGERSDDSILFDSTTMEPAINDSGFGIFQFNRPFDTFNEVLTQGWTVHFENYGTTDLVLDEIELVFHGNPIGANTQRVQGLIGVDDNRDDLFKFSRVNEFIFGTPGATRFGDVVNFVDPNHESMGANITVIATRASDGVIVDQFVTGADGNYYFDLVPDDYIISIVDPLGRTALEDSLTGAGFLQDYKTEWTISEDFFKAWDYDASLEVPVTLVNGVETPSAFLDGNGSEVITGMKHINFLLDPGAEVDPEVNFSGVVFADINGDGIFNTGDVNVPGVSVFGDVNRNGQLDSGELLVATDSNGAYSMTIPLNPDLASSVVNIGVITPSNWTFSDPLEGFKPFFVRPGDSISTDTDFAITPPVGEGPGNGTSQDGYLMGVVFTDSSGDGQLQPGELGQANIDVYIDSNGSGSFEIGERKTQTNVNGGFIFADVTPGAHTVRIEVAPPFEQTFPVDDGPQVVALAGGGTVSNILFGLFGDSSGGGGGGTATQDFGDLPAGFNITSLLADGARHTVGVFFLGATIDAETNGLPSTDALGDDNNFTDENGNIVVENGVNDEDGIVVDELVEGTLGHLVATASRFGGFLQGWIDFDGNGVFDEVSERIITDQLLVLGDNDVFFDIPATLTTGDIFARFRYGESGLGLTGAALLGEVEDYKLDRAAPVIVTLHGPDFDEDGDVDGLDFLSWQLGFGLSGVAVQASDGDSNSDEVVNGADFAEWGAEFGSTGPAAASAALVSSSNEEEEFNGLAFLSWQADFDGVAESSAQGDGGGSVQSAALTSGTDSSNDVPLAATAGGSDSTSLPVAELAEPSTYVFASSSTAAALTPVALSNVETTIAPRSVAPATVASLAGDNGQSEARQAGLASLTRKLNAAEDLGLRRLGRRTALPRLETRLSENRLDRTADIEERGREVQNRVLDRLFARRQRPLDMPIEHHHDDENVSEEALAMALGEETNWRFL